jgi:hypothetical protein
MRRTPSDIPPGMRTERMHERAGRTPALGPGCELTKALSGARKGQPRSGTSETESAPRRSELRRSEDYSGPFRVLP